LANIPQKGDFAKMEYNYNVNSSACAAGLARDLSQLLQGEPPVILCIGSSKIISDCYGPAVGYLLTDKYPLNAHVYGSLFSPVNALNLESTIRKINILHPHSKIIAIDSFVSKSDKDQIKLVYGPITPGLASGKNLPSIGDLSIIASSAVFGKNTYCMGKVFSLAQITAKLLYQSIPKSTAHTLLS
jgi:putative sporulation protein YyaC